MTRSRQQNVTAAQWSANGEALGATDLTLPENDPFGANVFSTSVQRERLPSTRAAVRLSFVVIPASVSADFDGPKPSSKFGGCRPARR